MQNYHVLWDAFVPTRCAAGPLALTPWECMFANSSYATIESPIFFVEAQTDKVVMPLHNGLPAVWDDKTHKECDNTCVAASVCLCTLCVGGVVAIVSAAGAGNDNGEVFAVFVALRV